MSRSTQKQAGQKVHDRIAQFAQRRPDHPAIRTDMDVVSYRTLFQTATRLSLKLRQYVPPGCLVGLYQELGVPYLTSLLAVLLADCAYVPLDTRDSSNHIVRLSAETGTRVLLTSEARLPELSSVLPRAASIKLARSQHLCSFSPDPPDEVCSKGRGFREPEPLDGLETTGLANVIFTSGSGGSPRAIARSHAAIIEHADSWAAILTRSERQRFLLACSPAFSMSMTAIFLALLSGETLILPSYGWTHNPRLLVECVARHRVTGLKVIPSLPPRLSTPLARSTTSFPQVLILSGEKATWDQVNAWRNVAPWCRMFNTYGLTEAFSVTAYEVPHGSIPSSGEVPIGRSLPGNDMMVLDGRLHVRGSCIAAGRVTAGRLAPLPLVRRGDEGWFPTADIGSVHTSGVFHFSCRLDGHIKSRGYLIDPVTIECALTTERGIAEAAVTIARDSDRLVALLVLDGEELDVRSLRLSLLSSLRSFEVPHVFRAVDEIPKLLSGKIDRYSCDPQSGHELFAIGNFGPKPSTDIERRIAMIIEERLGISPLGIDQGWYDLGGDSLGLQDFVLTLESEFAILLDAHLQPFTIRRFAQLAQGGSRVARDSGRGSMISYGGSIPVQSPNDLLDPLRHWQRIEIHDSSSDPYTVSQRIRLRRPEKLSFDQTSLRLEFSETASVDSIGETLAELIASHEGLRRSLNLETRQQVTYSFSGALLVPVFDGRDLSTRHTDSVVRSLFAMPLDPGTLPAMRWMLLRQKRHDLFLWQLSHTLVDVASTDVLARQFLEIYSKSGKVSRNELAADNRTRDWHCQMEAVRYSDEAISWTRDTISRYQQLVIYCKSELANRRLEAGTRNHRYTRQGNYQEVFICDAFDRTTSVASLLAPYVLSLSRWLGVSGVPLRVGSAAREYAAFKNCFRDVVGQFNDHFLVPVDTPWGASVAEIEAQLSGYFSFIRKHSINFDKIIDMLRGKGNPHFAALPTLFAAAPLGDLTARESEDGTVRTLPRPRWGRWSFDSWGTKIGLYTFRNGNSLDLLVHSKGIWSRAFDLFIEELLTLLPARSR